MATMKMNQVPAVTREKGGNRESRQSYRLNVFFLQAPLTTPSALSMNSWKRLTKTDSPPTLLTSTSTWRAETWQQVHAIGIGIAVNQCDTCIYIYIHDEASQQSHAPPANQNPKTMTLPPPSSTTTSVIIGVVIVSLIVPAVWSSRRADGELLEFPLNLEFLEAEFFLFGCCGHGLDRFAPNLTNGGPSPIVPGRLANLDHLTRDIITQFAYQEIGHLRAITKKVRGFERPQLDISAASFAKVMDRAFGRTLVPPFNPYADSLNFLLASYLVPYVGLTGYVGANPRLRTAVAKKLVAGLLGVESGQDAIIRAMLYERAMVKVQPYGITVAEFTVRISSLRNKLGHSGVRDEGIIVSPGAGPEGRVIGNVLAGDDNSLAYGRTPEEILRIVYGGGDEHAPGGFFPKGANGRIAKSLLQST